MKYGTALLSLSVFLTASSVVGCGASDLSEPPKSVSSQLLTLTEATLSSSTGTIQCTFKVEPMTAVDESSLDRAMYLGHVRDEDTGKSIRIFQIIRPFPSHDVDPALRYSEVRADEQLTVRIPGRLHEHLQMTAECREYLATKRGKRVAIVCEEAVHTKNRSESPQIRRKALEPFQCFVVD